MSYVEQNHSVKIKGGAKSDEDVAEFLKRLKVSAFFSRRLLAADEAGGRHEVERLVRDVRRDLSGELLMQNFFDRFAALSLGAQARHRRRRGRADGRRLLLLLLQRHARGAGAAGEGSRPPGEGEEGVREAQAGVPRLPQRGERAARGAEGALARAAEGGRHRAVHRERAGADRAERACPRWSRCARRRSRSRCT